MMALPRFLVVMVAENPHLAFVLATTRLLPRTTMTFTFAHPAPASRPRTVKA